LDGPPGAQAGSDSVLPSGSATHAVGSSCLTRGRKTAWLQSIAEPRVLPRPIISVARVRRFEDERDVAFYLPRPLPPVELLPELLLDLLLFPVKQVKAWLGVWSAHRKPCGDPLALNPHFPDTAAFR
jgi:hypothetical protein